MDLEGSLAGAWQQVGASRWGEEAMGGQGAKEVPGSRGGGVGLLTIEEVTMSVKSMLSGREGPGGWEGQSFIPPPRPGHAPALLSHPSGTPAPQRLLASLLCPSRIPQTSSPRTPAALPASQPLGSPSRCPRPVLPVAWALLACPSLITSSSLPVAPWHPPQIRVDWFPNTLVLLPPLSPGGGAPVGIQLSSRGQVG